MDVFNRPPAISEDTVQYTIYPPTDLLEKSSVITFATQLQSLVDSLLPDFLWHRDPFQLKVVPNPFTKDAWILEGRMRVGDSVDDEWCAVWLLKEISARWDVVVSVFDSDGEFLLIEAAEALPSWVKPTNSENRIWLHKSHLHLIPLSRTSPPHGKRYRRQLPGANHDDDEDGNLDEQEDYLAVQDALTLVRDTTADTQAPQSVENIVWQRISGYPTSARNHVHITKAYLPVDIARALSVNPSLVQQPVETFYTRDAIQLRSAHRMSRFPPQPSTLSCVRLTRTAYAQLVAQKFHPPKIFGRWREQEGSTEWRWRDVGMKLNTPDAIKSSVQAQKDASRRNPDYVKYIQSLVSLGYFRGELEGSQLWNELEDKAVANFLEFSKETDATRPSFASRFSAALSNAPDVIPSSAEGREDSDSWLNVDARDFDDMLARTLGHTKDQSSSDFQPMDTDQPEGEQGAEDAVTKEQTSRLQDLAKKVEGFVEGEGDIEGARFQDEEFSDEEMSGDDDDEKMLDSDDESSDETSDTDLAARQVAMDKLVAPLDPSEYGQMPPSFHSNSQRVTKVMVDNDVVEADSGSGPSIEEVKPARQVRAPILTRDTYEGVDSDDETDEEDIEEDEDSEEDRPQVVGEVEVDMEEEMTEFLEFSRQTLGISDAQWGDIVREREGRSAFVPPSLTPTQSNPTGERSHSTKKESTKVDIGSSGGSLPEQGHSRNPNLDSFEAVMQAMDAELARTRKAPSIPKTGSPMASAAKSSKAQGKSPDVEDDADVEEDMDAELKAILEREDLDDDDELGEGEGMDYNLIKNFLESFKSQAGLSGPVSNLAGRLQPEWALPRDGL
ncbi:hypothetical protein SERLA73DRAFT_70211 [Serpula lacrymans var. lacrymans S7.3]|uniref:SGT1-domain-containing protein n=1 Tax=Serpula lacrymans var. lacrymans (strain S7.3) TaxID=936435 RepID=F8PM93_SERL3|nr:hypothetical protein SERLA73DRAFT_70211 [Serpula lacrymans var. lacrymans S7.3]